MENQDLKTQFLRHVYDQSGGTDRPVEKATFAMVHAITFKQTEDFTDDLVKAGLLTVHTPTHVCLTRKGAAEIEGMARAAEEEKRRKAGEQERRRKAAREIIEDLPRYPEPGPTFVPEPGRSRTGQLSAMSWPVEIEITVPWRDVDGAGHVNNAVYLSYLETARCMACLRHFGWREPSQYRIIVARAAIDFVSPASMHETLLVRTRPSRIGASSFDLSYEITEKATGREVARAKTVQVWYDYAKGKKEHIPPNVRKRLEAGLTA